MIRLPVIDGDVLIGEALLDDDPLNIPNVHSMVFHNIRGHAGLTLVFIAVMDNLKKRGATHMSYIRITKNITYIKSHWEPLGFYEQPFDKHHTHMHKEL